MSILLTTFRQAGIDYQRQREEARQQQIKADEEEKKRIEQEECEKQKRRLKGFFSIDLWEKLEALGGTFSPDGKTYSIGDDSFFVEINRIDFEPSDYTDALYIKNKDNQKCEVMRQVNGATEETLGFALLELYSDFDLIQE